MTLGGLALAVGVLVDDATVTIENIERFLEEGNDLHEAILSGAGQIAVPALVSTLSSPANGSVSSASRSSRAELGAQVQLALGDVALALAQAAQLSVHLRGLGVQLLFRDARGQEVLLRDRAIGVHFRAGRVDLLATGGEVRRGLDGFADGLFDRSALKA